ncbi:MAG TPA: phage major capsid protein [Micromonosporaceae bacterium]|nr:phage major capsid protein [Micromonosporaceae bacterium]
MSDIEILAELRGKDVTTMRDNETPEELRGKTPDELQGFLEILDAHLRTIHQDEDTGELRDKTPDEQKAFAYGLKLRDKAVKMIDEHRAVQEVFRRRPKAVEAAYANLGKDKDDAYGDVRRLTVPQARDKALRVLDDRNAAAHLRPDEKDEVEKQIRTSTDIARRILVTENEDYREAWMKLVTQPHPMLSPEEVQAVRAYNEYRAASEGTTTAGGFGIPVFIDPSIILTAQGSGNPFLRLARQVDINTNIWKGVSSAGVTWSFDTEASAVSDDMATLAQPTVTVFMARGFIPYSIEIGQDYPGFAQEMQTLLSAGYDELLVDKFTRGSGTNEPKGILTCLSANTNVRVRAATNTGAISAADPYNLWQAVPQRNRRNASWLMNVSLNNAIRQLGTANVYHASTVTLPEGAVEMLFNRGVYESPYMPNLTTTTSSTEGYVIAGDFSNYVIARRGGMSVELIPQIFQQATAGSAYGMPTGQRGWFAYSRIGGSSANDLGFRLLVNT